MSGRDITAGMKTALEDSVIRPVLIGRLDILTDPITAWTGPGTFVPTTTGDAAMDGQVFTNMAPFVELTDITEDQGIGEATSLVITGHDLDEELLRQVVRDRRQWRGRKAYLWLGLLNVDEATVVANPIRIKTGIMSQMTVKRNQEEATIMVEVDRDLGRAKGAPWRWIDHQRLFVGDTWSSFIQDLANQPEGFTNGGITDWIPGTGIGDPRNGGGGRVPILPH